MHERDVGTDGDVGADPQSGDDTGVPVDAQSRQDAAGSRRGGPRASRTVIRVMSRIVEMTRQTLAMDETRQRRERVANTPDDIPESSESRTETSRTVGHVKAKAMERQWETMLAGRTTRNRSGRGG